eukprot:TRINITY_DN6805_c0_g1_i1.p1 TRINITY_DN6805_c0_g1~~TRINITY_DN6805_c0_g1_i1.p1  ORF type:complete len:654 (+),score=191.06 TRINITY_DN6805_c0_g1_i1:58-2019(+)
MSRTDVRPPSPGYSQQSQSSIHSVPLMFTGPSVMGPLVPSENSQAIISHLTDTVCSLMAERRDLEDIVNNHRAELAQAEEERLQLLAENQVLTLDISKANMELHRLRTAPVERLLTAEEEQQMDELRRGIQQLQQKLQAMALQHESDTAKLQQADRELRQLRQARSGELQDEEKRHAHQLAALHLQVAQLDREYALRLETIEAEYKRSQAASNEASVAHEQKCRGAIEEAQREAALRQRAEREQLQALQDAEKAHRRAMQELEEQFTERLSSLQRDTGAAVARQVKESQKLQQELEQQRQQMHDLERKQQQLLDDIARAKADAEQQQRKQVEYQDLAKERADLECQRKLEELRAEKEEALRRSLASLDEARVREQAAVLKADSLREQYEEEKRKGDSFSAALEEWRRKERDWHAKEDVLERQAADQRRRHELREEERNRREQTLSERLEETQARMAEQKTMLEERINELTQREKAVKDELTAERAAAAEKQRTMETALRSAEAALVEMEKRLTTELAESERRLQSEREESRKRLNQEQEEGEQRCRELQQEFEHRHQLLEQQQRGATMELEFQIVRLREECERLETSTKAGEEAAKQKDLQVEQKLAGTRSILEAELRRAEQLNLKLEAQQAELLATQRQLSQLAHENRTLQV